MKTTRREFIQISTAAGAGLMFLRGGRAYAFSQSIGLRKFIQPLRGVSLPPYTSPGIPVALPDALSIAPGVKPGLPNGLDHYSIHVGQYTDQLHPDLPNATRLWGYADAAHGGVHRHLGGVVAAHRGRPVQLTFTNALPGFSVVPIDATLPGANQSPNRIAVHLHGGFIPWFSDGGPHDWFDPTGLHGLSFVNNTVPYPVVPVGGWQPGQAEYYWSMDLGARMLWYHDHAWGITRTNAYSGVATALLIRDPSGPEGALIAQGLPKYIEAGGREIPLVIQDKIFWDPLSDPAYPTYIPSAAAGDLWYAYVYEKARWKYNTGKYTPPTPSCIPEFFGDTMLVNGTVYPNCQVARQRYRFRLLNACQAKFLNVQLFYRDNSTDGITLNPKTGLPTNVPGPPITIIGTEGGFLPAPVTVNNPPVPFNPVTFSGNLIVAPAERFDLLIDFSGVPWGSKLILYTDAPAPFPVGDPRNDYYVGSPNPTITTPGYGPDTRQLLQFDVTGDNPAYPPATEPALGTVLAGLAMDPPSFPGLTQGIVPRNFANPTKNPFGATTVRMLTLNENFDAYGRLQQTMGTNVLQPTGIFGQPYMNTPTEVVPAGTTEIWQIANLTGDTHPIHFHLVNVQIVARQPFSVNNFNGVPNYTAPARPPEPYEQGWKETVRMNPGEVTTVVATFVLPSVPFQVPVSPRTGGNEYVYHCHILEHEEHDMMRPLVVT